MLKNVKGTYSSLSLRITPWRDEAISYIPHTRDSALHEVRRMPDQQRSTFSLWPLPFQLNRNVPFFKVPFFKTFWKIIVPVPFSPSPFRVLPLLTLHEIHFTFHASYLNRTATFYWSSFL
jgi:hypothetical protein